MAFASAFVTDNKYVLLLSVSWDCYLLWIRKDFISKDFMKLSITIVGEENLLYNCSTIFLILPVKIFFSTQFGIEWKWLQKEDEKFL